MNRPGNIEKLLNELPYKMKLELLMCIHSETYQTVTYFKDKDPVFFSWIVYLLRPLIFTQHQYICRESEQLTDIYFITVGEMAYVLPSYNNAVFVKIGQGSNIGHLDIYGSYMEQNKFAKNEFLNQKLKDLHLNY